MKRIIALTFLSLYLISTTELHQLLKLPALVEHFSEHQQKDKTITLWKFLCIHYANGNKKDADYEKDSKLPFKTKILFQYDFSIHREKRNPKISSFLFDF